MLEQIHPPTETADEGSRATPAPMPWLRLFTETLLVTDGAAGHREERLAVLSLRFAYSGGATVVAAADREGVASELLDRDLGAEATAERLLEGFGAVDIRCVDD